MESPELEAFVDLLCEENGQTVVKLADGSGKSIPEEKIAPDLFCYLSLQELFQITS